MSFHLTLRHRFPGSLDQREYVSMASAALHQAGFTREDTIVALCTCRDEITRSLQRLVETTWGPTFDMSGLAGMLSAGTFGLRAALAHRPQLGDRSHLVVFAMTHVGIDDDGTIGAFRRDRIDQPVATCGSLAAVAATAGQDRTRSVDVDDLEQSRLEQRLAPMLDPNDRPDLADLAETALACLERDLDSALERVVGERTGRPLGIDGGLFTGIQIHGPYDRGYVWPSTSVIELDGQTLPGLPVIGE